MYRRNSAVRFGKTMRKKRQTLTIKQKKQLEEHKDFHLKENPKPNVDRHIKIMSDLMKGGDSFNKSHTEAQKIEPMKERELKTFDELNKMFKDVSFNQGLEQDEVGKKIKDLLKRFKEDIDALPQDQQQHFLNNENWF